MHIQYTAKALAKLKKLREGVDSLRDKGYFSPEATVFLAAMSNVVEEIFQYNTAVKISNDYELEARACQCESSFLKDFNDSGAPYQDPYNRLATDLDGLIKTIEIGLDISDANREDAKNTPNACIELVMSKRGNSQVDNPVRS